MDLQNFARRGAAIRIGQLRDEEAALLTRWPDLTSSNGTGAHAPDPPSANGPAPVERRRTWRHTKRAREQRRQVTAAVLRGFEAAGVPLTFEQLRAAIGAIADRAKLGVLVRHGYLKRRRGRRYVRTPRVWVP